MTPGAVRSRLTLVLGLWNSKTMKRVAQLAAAVATITCLLPGVAHAVARVYLLRMDGYVGQHAEGHRAMADLVLRASGKDVPFQVTSARVLSGQMHAATVFSRVRPYRPNFILRGDRTLLGKVAHAAPGKRLRIDGHWRPGSRDLMVSSVETRPSAHRTAER